MTEFIEDKKNKRRKRKTRKMPIGYEIGTERIERRKETKSQCGVERRREKERKKKEINKKERVGSRKKDRKWE